MLSWQSSFFQTCIKLRNYIPLNVMSCDSFLLKHPLENQFDSINSFSDSNPCCKTSRYTAFCYNGNLLLHKFTVAQACRNWLFSNQPYPYPTVFKHGLCWSWICFQALHPPWWRVFCCLTISTNHLTITSSVMHNMVELSNTFKFCIEMFLQFCFCYTM